jgi:hypothetical protein
MRAMFGRDDMDPPRQDPPRREQQSGGSSSQGLGNQYTNPSVGWNVRAGQGVPAFPGSRIVPTRRVESSNTSAQQAQALLRANQEQRSMMPPLNTSSSSGARGAIGSTPVVHPLSTPSTGFRTRELHGPDYYHIGSQADQGYAEHMRAMFGRDDMDPPRQDPPRREQQSGGSSSQGLGSQYTNPSVGWNVRAGQGVPAFPGSRIVPARRVDYVTLMHVRLYVKLM